ncbi:MAG: AAA family ATPase [Chloroflexi bacterium]|nr:AAA family ATPase [Chloroflexota bacterium]
MARVIQPPLDQLQDLPTPLTAGERQVLDLFNSHLPQSWEIYVQPHLNGLRPDFVLLNPGAGVGVFEVKDWDLAAMDYWAQPSPLGKLPKLMARNREGATFSLEAENPVAKVRRYKEEIFNLYCPNLAGEAGLAAITAGVIFTRTLGSEVEQLLAPFYTPGESRFRKYYPVAGSDDLRSESLTKVFPEFQRTNSLIMHQTAADDLRGWLHEPYFSREQRELPVLNARQREIATTRTAAGYRRVKGPAGSGKSVALASRSAELAATGNTILVSAFNITMINYLRDLASRYRPQREAIKREIDFLHFHRWCRRVCEAAGAKDQYDGLWTTFDHDEVLNRRMAELVQGIYTDRQQSEHAPRYDAIMVDEGQDFFPAWWNTLRLALNPGGEMLLVADKTQNIYGRARNWTDAPMPDAGFNGPWFTLDSAYRLPAEVIPLLQEYSNHFLANEEVDIPAQLSLSGPAHLRWVQIDPRDDAADVCVTEARRQMTRLHIDTANPDIVFVAPNDDVGRQFVERFTAFSVNVLHTFDRDDAVSRRQKLAFWKGAPNIKATTMHSFKGWESRHLVVFVNSVESREDRALLYTALTRLLQHENGSSLTVISSCQDPQLRAFGRTWPEFVDVDDAGRQTIGRAPEDQVNGPQTGLMDRLRAASVHASQTTSQQSFGSPEIPAPETRQRINENSTESPEQITNAEIAVGARVHVAGFGSGKVERLSKTKVWVVLDRGTRCEIALHLLR